MRKQKTMKRILFPIIAALILCSCEKVLEVETDDEQLMVLNGVPSAGKQMFVNLTYSHFFLDTCVQHPIDGAQMTISINGTEMTPSQVVGCNYFFPYTLAEDDTVAITVNAAGRTLAAKTFVPRLPMVSNVTSHIDTSLVFNFLDVDFDLADHADYSDLYHIVITCRDSGRRHNPYTDSIDHIDTVVRKMFYCGDQSMTSSEVSAYLPLGGYFFQRLLITDKLIDGQEKRVRLMMPILIDTNEIAPFRHDYTLDIETVTPARFRYIVQSNRAANNMMLFSDAPQVQSNVNGGYGVFAGNARRTFPLTPDTASVPLFALPTMEAGEVMKRLLQEQSHDELK